MSCPMKIQQEQPPGHRRHQGSHQHGVAGITFLEVSATKALRAGRTCFGVGTALVLAGTAGVT